MSDPLPPDEPSLFTSMRVIRGNDTHQNLVETFPELEQKALGSPSTLTDSERRRLLDLPDADDEAANIARVSTRSRNELLSAALSDAAVLSNGTIHGAFAAMDPEVGKVHTFYDGVIGEGKPFYGVE